MNIPIMRGSRGIKSQSDPVRSAYSTSQSPYTKNTGLVDLAACMNVDISDKFRVSRRRGVTRKVAISAHSLHPVGDRYCLFVSGTDLNLLLPSLTEYVTVAQVSEAPLSCFVLDGIAYWGNGIQKGKIVDAVNVEWVGPPVVYGNKTRAFYDPPAGKLLGFYAGRMYAAVDRVVWYSEPFGPDLWSLSDSFLSFESPVTMVRGVANGLFVSDSEQVWFLGGNGPDSFEWKVVDNHPAITHSDKAAVGMMQITSDGSYEFADGGKIECAFWLSNNGVMFGSGSGETINLTDEKMDLLGPYSRGSVLVDGAALIAQFLDGAPVSTTDTAGVSGSTIPGDALTIDGEILVFG